MKKISDLKPAEYNPRTITKKQLAALKKSMEEFGPLDGVVVNVRTGRLVGGHQRTKIFHPSWTIVSNPMTDGTGTVAAGHVETPYGKWSYREVDWPEGKEKAANLAANRHGGEFDMMKVSDIIIELKTIDFDLEITGFEDVEIKKMLGDGNGGDAGGDDGMVSDQYMIVVVCQNEVEQVKLLERFQSEGIECKALIS